MADFYKTSVALPYAKGIAFDGCHKIYVLMDDDQMAQMKEYGYDPLISSDEMTPEEMFKTVKGWYDKSCPLRFISAVRTVKGDPNKGFITLIDQGDGDEADEDWDDEEEEA